MKFYRLFRNGISRRWRERTTLSVIIILFSAFISVPPLSLTLHSSQQSSTSINQVQDTFILTASNTSTSQERFFHTLHDGIDAGSVKSQCAEQAAQYIVDTVPAFRVLSRRLLYTLTTSSFL